MTNGKKFKHDLITFAEADKKLLEKTVSGVHSALERRHPEETRLLRELVIIGVSDPKCQDYILNGGSVTFEPYPWKDPSNGKRIPEKYCQEVIIKKEGNGNDWLISMCGMRIAGFFKQIWAKVTEALGLKKKVEHPLQFRTLRLGSGYFLAVYPLASGLPETVALSVKVLSGCRYPCISYGHGVFCECIMRKRYCRTLSTQKAQIKYGKKIVTL